MFFSFRLTFWFLISLSIESIHASTFYENDPAALKEKWDKFKATFSKRYQTFEEETARFGHFINNLKLIDTQNKRNVDLGGTEVHGITMFLDLSIDEFKQKYLTQSDKLDENSMKASTYKTSTFNVPLNMSGSRDWTNIYTTPVKNQAGCGSCWAFSATEQIESDAIRTLGWSTSDRTKLSTGQVTECTYDRNGCDGGWPIDAYQAVHNKGGIELATTYNYLDGNDGQYRACSYHNSPVIGISQAWRFTGDEGSQASFVQNTGPIAVCLFAQSWFTYSGGVLYDCMDQGGHCVQAVGVNFDGESYWKIRNSWGTGFGEGGHIRLAYGRNTCQLSTQQSSYVDVYRK